MKMHGPKTHLYYVLQNVHFIACIKGFPSCIYISNVQCVQINHHIMTIALLLLRICTIFKQMVLDRIIDIIKLNIHNIENHILKILILFQTHETPIALGSFYK